MNTKNIGLKIGLISAGSALLGTLAGLERAYHGWHSAACWAIGIAVAVLYAVVVCNPKTIWTAIRDAYREVMGPEAVERRLRLRKVRPYLRRKYWQRFKIMAKYLSAFILSATSLLATSCLLASLTVEEVDPDDADLSVLGLLASIVFVYGLFLGVVAISARNSMSKRAKSSFAEFVPVLLWIAVSANPVGWIYWLFRGLFTGLPLLCRLTFRKATWTSVGRFFALIFQMLNVSGRRACVVCGVVGFTIGFAFESGLLALFVGGCLGYFQNKVYLKWFLPKIEPEPTAS